MFAASLLMTVGVAVEEIVFVEHLIAAGPAAADVGSRNLTEWPWEPDQGTPLAMNSGIVSTNTINHMSFNPQGTMLAIALNVSPYLLMFEWDGTSGIGTSLSVPHLSSAIRTVEWNNNGSIIVTTTNSNVWFYPVTSAGVSESIGYTLISGANHAIFNPNNDLLVAVATQSTSGSLTTYRRTNGTGTLTSGYRAPSSLSNPKRIAFNSTGNLIAMISSAVTYPKIYEYIEATNDYGGSATASGGVSGGASDIKFAPDDLAVVVSVTGNSSVSVQAWPVNGINIGTKFADPGLTWGVSTVGATCMDISDDGSAVALGSTAAVAPNNYALAFNSSTGFGTHYAGGNSQPSAGCNTIKFSPLVAGSPPA